MRFPVAAMRERYRDAYLEHRDPIPGERLRWRAQVFRQLVHLLPKDSILELGTGSGAFARVLNTIARGESRVVRLTFNEISSARGNRTVDAVTPDEVQPGAFDHVIALDVLDEADVAEILELAFSALKPGGQAVFVASNPGNPFLKVRQLGQRLAGREDPRGLLDHDSLLAALSAAGFITTAALYTDFLYAPLSRRGTRLLHGLSAIMQNMTGVRTLSGSIIAHARKPGEKEARDAANLADRAELIGKISVVVPCHNEEMNLRPLVNRLRGHFDRYLHEIVLVDDNSTDSTRAVIESLREGDSRVVGVFREPPGGVGHALRDGYAAATGEYILSLDADFQHLLPELRDVFDAAADGADVVVGSRFSPDSVLLNYPVRKIIANRAFHLLASIALRSPHRDLTNNLKLMKAEVARRISFTEQGFAVNAETGFEPLVLGYRTVEVPISWIGRGAEEGISSFKLASAGPGYLRVLRRLRADRKSRTGRA